MTYSIIRIFNPRLRRKSKIIKTGLTLKEAKEHCQDSSTKKEGKWFDGYISE